MPMSLLADQQQHVVAVLGTVPPRFPSLTHVVERLQQEQTRKANDIVLVACRHYLNPKWAGVTTPLPAALAALRSDTVHVHLRDEGPIDHTDDPIFELSKSWILWTNLCPQSVRRSLQNWNPMWISLLRHVSESVCYQSGHLLRRDDSYIKSATNSTDSLMEHENMDDNRVIGEHSLPGFSMNEKSKLYLLIGSDNTNGLNACISAEFYKYLAAVHITRHNGKETALLCIAEGGHISTAISKSSLFPQKKSALRRRIARARRAITSACCVLR